MNKGKSTFITRNSQSGKFVMSRPGMEKLNAVEGVKQSAASRVMTNELDRRGASADERRRAIAAKYAKKG